MGAEEDEDYENAEEEEDDGDRGVLSHMSTAFQSRFMQNGGKDSITAGEKVFNVVPGRNTKAKPRTNSQLTARPPSSHAADMLKRESEVGGVARNHSYGQLASRLAGTERRKQRSFQGSVTSRPRRTSGEHFVPPMMDFGKFENIDAAERVYAAIKREKDNHPYDMDLQNENMKVIECWLERRLGQSEWVKMITSIKALAEGNSSRAHDKALTSMKVDRTSLLVGGVPEEVTLRVYRALWVYSLGIREVMQEVSGYCQNSTEVMGPLWKVYAILFESYNPSTYMLALNQIEKTSQQVLGTMHGKFSEMAKTSETTQQQLRVDLDRFAGVLDQKIKSITLLETKVVAQQDVLERIDQALKGKISENTEFKEELKEKKRGLDRAKRDIEEITERSEDMQRTLTESVIQLQQKYADLNDRLAKEQEEKMAIMKSVEHLKTQLKNSLHKVDQTKRVRKKDKMDAEVGHANAELLKDEVEDLRNRLADIEYKFELEQETNSEQKDEFKKEQKINEKLQKELTEKTQLAASNDKACKKFEALYEEVKNEKTKLKEKLKKMAKANKATAKANAQRTSLADSVIQGGGSDDDSDSSGEDKRKKKEKTKMTAKEPTQQAFNPDG